MQEDVKGVTTGTRSGDGVEDASDCGQSAEIGELVVLLDSKLEHQRRSPWQGWGEVSLSPVSPSLAPTPSLHCLSASSPLPPLRGSVLLPTCLPSCLPPLPFPLSTHSDGNIGAVSLAASIRLPVLLFRLYATAASSA